MNIYAIITVALSFVYVYTSFFMASNNNLKIYVDPTSLFIVVAGSFVAIMLSLDVRRFIALIWITVRRFFSGKKYNFKKLIMELMRLAEATRNGQPLQAQLETLDDDFLKESVGLIAERIMEPEEAIQVLSDRNDNLLELNETEASRVKVLAKFPPAFGMIGTTMGMIALLANLGGDDAMKMIGPAMAVALITTLYGAVLANLFFIPLAENLVSTGEEIHLKNKIIIDGVKLLQDKTNPVIIAEKLNSYLPANERLDWKQVVK